MIEPGAPSPEGEEIFTGRTLLDYKVLIDVENPGSTNQDRTQEQKAELERLGHHFEIIPVETTGNKYETALIIEEAMGDNADQCVVWARTGDGGNGGPIRAAIGRKAALWQANSGFANNLSRASFVFYDRISPRRILDRAKIARTHPLICTVTTPNGEVIYNEYLADQFDVGNMANAQMLREAADNREYLRKVGVIRRVIRSARLGAEAIDAAPPFEIARTVKQPDGTTERSPVVETYNELALSNIGHIAWIGRIRGISMTDQKMVEVTNSYKTKLGPRIFHLMLFTVGVAGRDIPDGQAVEFDLLTDANAQGSGDPFPVPSGSHVSIQRDKRELLVVTTRNHP